MRAFDPEFAEMRFGYGLSPVVPPPRSIEHMLGGLTGPDLMADRFAIPGFDIMPAIMLERRRLNRLFRQNKNTDLGEAARKDERRLQRRLRQDMWRWMGQTMLRRAYTPAGFRERLVAFWADHFSARGKSGLLRRAGALYVEDAIRPHVAGRFADMLRAAVMHPLMLDYLDQHRSVGPNSRRAARGGRISGLNENLARELMELHTLGVGAPYGQSDVTQLAELLAGLTYTPEKGVRFVKAMAEPGAETVLGRTYSDASTLAPVEAALEDLAAHPATARHIARKLAVHFVSDTPPQPLVDHLAARFSETDGDLAEVCAALLDHPAAWAPEGANVKMPDEFVASALRALAVPPERIEGLGERQIKNVLVTPMAIMGQLWQRFPGPDGWPEKDSAWISPAGLAGRVQWAMAAPLEILGTLPDPVAFAHTALGARAGADVLFAAGAAESRAEAVGIVLMSPAFQRR